MIFFRRILLFIFILIGSFTLKSQDDGFFSVRSIRFFKRESSRDMAIFREVVVEGKKNYEFLPYIRVSVSTRNQQSSKKLFAKAYFYDSEKQLEAVATPYPIARNGSNEFAFPAIFFKEKPENIYFAVPQNVLKHKGWSVVVIFGDQYEIDARAYPRGDAENFHFPEKKRYQTPVQIYREIFIDPVIEYKVRTQNSKQPQITFYVRFPVGISNSAESQGVLAMCLLANNVEEIKRRLQNLNSDDEVGGLLRFAQDNKLTVICWGAKRLWDPRANWDEQSKRTNRLLDQDFDEIADAWADGIDDISKKYRIPKNKFLLWGISAAGQYAARLALRKPEYFQAIHIHIPSSFDNPTPKAKQILWCLTTGENEIGYARSLRFLRECQKLGYPIIYKAIPGLGHSGHPNAEQLGLAFFKYALKEQLKATGNQRRILPNANLLPNKALQRNLASPESFRNPVFWGDVINQQRLSLFEMRFTDANNCIPLPTKELAEIWIKE